MQNDFGKMTAEIQRPKQAQHGFLIDCKQLGEYVNYICKCFENSLSTMLEKL